MLPPPRRKPIAPAKPKKAAKAKASTKYSPNVALAYFEECGLPPAITEHQFALGIVFYMRKDGREDSRRWAFDFAWLEHRVALEVEGLSGRHQFTGGFLKDMQKYNTATVLGWRILRVTNKAVCMQETIDMIRKCLEL